MRLRRFGRLRTVSIAAVTAAAALLTFFAIGSFNDDGPPAAAVVPTSNPTLAEPPGPDVTPEPGSRPDLTQPWWYVPYLNQDRQATGLTLDELTRVAEGLFS